MLYSGTYANVHLPSGYIVLFWPQRNIHRRAFPCFRQRFTRAVGVLRILFQPQRGTF